MLQKMLLTTIWGRIIMVLSVTGILLRMITILSYKRMKTASENPGKTKRQWVQLLKKRYESYEKFGRMKNVEAFVEHYFARKGILGIPLSVWDKAGAALPVAVVLIGMLGLGALFNDGDSVREMLGLMLIACMSGAGLFLLHIIGDAREAKRQIVVALTDYLENGTAYRGKKEEGQELRKRFPAKEEVEAFSEAAVTAEEKMVLEEVLEEYFW